ncbi:MAG: hypothetical protein AAF745_07100 [Planctomycetota bacterium]
MQHILFRLLVADGQVTTFRFHHVDLVNGQIVDINNLGGQRRAFENCCDVRTCPGGSMVRLSGSTGLKGEDIHASDLF